MKQGSTYWCINCYHLGKQHETQGRVCIQCLRNIIMDNLDDIEEPMNYRKGV